MNPHVNHGDHPTNHAKTSFLKVYIQEVKRIGWKQFWKQNNKAIKFLLKLLLAAFIWGIIDSTNFIQGIKYEPNPAKIYFLITLGVFTLSTLYPIWFYINVGVKQDYNTSQFTRVKEKSYKGVDWKKAEAPFKNKGN